jgi:SEC-C motif
MKPDPSVGRNSLCHCGSGKKYKKCCLAADTKAMESKPAIDTPGNAARMATFESAAMGIHPYSIMKMVTTSSPDVLSGLSKHDIAALKDKWSLAKVALLETDEIVSRLKKLGIDGSHASFAMLTSGSNSAWSIGNIWIDGLSAQLGAGEEDFICLSACELWKRYCPGRPSMEMLDDWVTEGYELLESRKHVEAVEIWLRVWQYVRPRIEPHMTTFDAANAVFHISQFFGNWIQDFTMETRNAAIREPKCAEMGIRVIHELLGQFVDEDLDTILYFRGELGALLFHASRFEEGEATLQSIICEYPERSRGYAELAGAMGCSTHGTPDFPRAISILEQALAYPVIDASDYDLKFRLDDLRENMRASAATSPS